MPELWTFQLFDTRSEEECTNLQGWMRRSGELPVDIFIEFIEKFTEEDL